MDILVATPGRLVEHLRAGGGFTLQHLRWLVVDEADRLLSHGYQEWISAVLAAAYRAPRGDGADAPTASDAAPQTRRPWAASVETLARGPPTAGVRGRCGPLTKMLFSATLTRSPARLAALHLQRPRFFCVDMGGFAFDARLLQSVKGVPWDYTGRRRRGTNATEWRGGESEFIEQLLPNSYPEDLMPLGNCGHDVLVMHNAMDFPEGHVRAHRMQPAGRRVVCRDHGW